MKYKLIMLLSLIGWLTLVGQSRRPDTLGFSELVAWVKNTVHQQPDLAYAHLPYVLDRTERYASEREKISVYHDLSQLYYYYRPQYGIDSAVHYQQLTLRAARRLGDSSLVASRLRELAIYLKNTDRAERGRRRIFESLALYEQLDDAAGTAAAQRVLCDFCRDAGQYDLALRYARYATEYYRSQGQYDRVDDTRLCELTTLFFMADFPATIALGQRMVADRNAGRIERTSNRVYILDLMFNAQLNIRDTTSAIRTGREVLVLERNNMLATGNPAGYLETKAQLAMIERKFVEVISALEALNGLYGTEVVLSSRVEWYTNLVTALRRTGNYREALLRQDTLMGLLEQSYAHEVEEVRAELIYRYEDEQQKGMIALQRDQLTTQRRNQRRTVLFVLLLLVSLLGLGLLLRTNVRRRRELAGRNAENELLLREIHHRVKNNLEIVSSLLELQSDEMQEGVARSAMQTGQNRVRSIGLLHQRLYQNNHLASVELCQYFEDLADNLLETYDPDGHLRIGVEVPESYVNVDTAVPLGLIANELLTNSIKYAYPDGSGGRIRLRLTKVPTNEWQLSVRDWGLGKGDDHPQGTGFGSQLVRLLTRQLNGRLEEFDDHGLHTVMVFPPDV